MVQEQLVARGIADQQVIDAMAKVPRDYFVPDRLKGASYDDQALPLGPDQTISQPYVVALMLEAAAINKADKILEIGTGSGYEAALLAELGGQVYSIEIDKGLHRNAKTALDALGYRSVNLKAGDGYLGWKENSPFDVIIISAAPPEIPRELMSQLNMGGRMILPLGREAQELVVIKKTESGLEVEELGGVRFVPMRRKESVS